MTKTTLKTESTRKKGSITSIIRVTRVTKRAARDIIEMVTPMMRATEMEMAVMIAMILVSASTARRSTSIESTTRNLTKEITVDLRSQDLAPGPLETVSLTQTNMVTQMLSKSQTLRHLAWLIRSSPISV